MSSCYGVTTSAPESQPAPTIIDQVQRYLNAYVSFADSVYAFVIALWLAATHCWLTFDAFPYLVVTSGTKRSGKTRLLELQSFVAANARSVAHVSPAAMFHIIQSERPTLLVDEAEAFSSPNSEFRPLLNTGYCRGQTVLRQHGGNTVEYETYCPKAFALIGDVYDTLRDRSIVIGMRRGTASQRFVFSIAHQDGTALRDKLHEIVEAKAAEVYEAAVSFDGLPFLTDRDEEIWTPLFVICAVLCPDRIEELTRAAVDIATAKTANARKFTELAAQEKVAEEQEYSERLLFDIVSVIGDRKHITTAELIPLLREIPTSPWRKFRGAGLKDGIDGAMDIAALLSRFGVSPKTLRIAPKGEKNSTAKGYDRQALQDAAEHAGLIGRNLVTQPVEVPITPSLSLEQVGTFTPDEAEEDKSGTVATPGPALEPAAIGPEASATAVPAQVTVTVYPIVLDTEVEDSVDGTQVLREDCTPRPPANYVPKPLKPGKNYTVRPIPSSGGGHGIYEVGSDILWQWHADKDDAWDEITEVFELPEPVRKSIEEM
ncbi:MAG: hypothetical protein CXZ00_15675 [Acidobacteria bacterium]|nr:MAG: hypothetical protein CXZ00_15675 [Acidobacteriota bacterium]